MAMCEKGTTIAIFIHTWYIHTYIHTFRYYLCSHAITFDCCPYYILFQVPALADRPGLHLLAAVPAAAATAAVNPLAVGRDDSGDVLHAQADGLEPAVLLHRRARHHHERLLLGDHQHTRLPWERFTPREKKKKKRHHRVSGNFKTKHRHRKVKKR